MVQSQVEETTVILMYKMRMTCYNWINTNSSSSHPLFWKNLCTKKILPRLKLALNYPIKIVLESMEENRVRDLTLSLLTRGKVIEHQMKSWKRPPIFQEIMKLIIRGMKKTIIQTIIAMIKVLLLLLARHRKQRCNKTNNCQKAIIRPIKTLRVNNHTKIRLESVLSQLVTIRILAE